ncbi:SRPBCC family protein [Amycolatopsis rubida]|uniref:SRPBCC family protein n=1 Tax=Amycolatopsis rubida TaxID=112413 RepID=A0ABX0C845_9PSEU|nr:MULTISPECIES: SRPBCC family protein [Amycolatopsis]MYW96190.1 carbon monoxide dehydrogenase [Amycolatopsis rubida]NEC61181.1 SRPBCC family protein [Amycolatopsis rubida]OAP24294.1 Carbon monoxide dehydrogenase subunit G (CoxG) [Amycolatopsis sp. M39]
MQLQSKFTIAAPLETAWETVNNPEIVAPCLPGAVLTEYEGDSFTGTVKMKLGPITLNYRGTGTYVERDKAGRTVVIDASGRDGRGNGTARAVITARMTADGPDKTEVAMVTDIALTGRPAQFGRGMIADVTDKIISQFSARLAEELAGSGTAGSLASESGDRPSSRRADEPINVLELAGTPRAVQIAYGLIALGVLLPVCLKVVRRLRAQSTEHA